MISWNKMKADGLFEKLQKVWTRDMLIGLVLGMGVYIYLTLMLPGFLVAMQTQMTATGSSSEFIFGCIKGTGYSLSAAAPVCVLFANWAPSLFTRSAQDSWKPWMLISIAVYDVILFGTGFAIASLIWPLHI